MKNRDLIRTISLGILSALVYFYFFHHLPRTEFSLLLWLVAFLFMAYASLVSKAREHFYLMVGFGVAFRLTALFAPVSLSEDVYRFLWDGTLVLAGDNPFTQLPCFYAVNEMYDQGLSAELYAQLNSPKYYSIYPPVVQYMSAAVVWISAGDFSVAIDVFRVLFLLVELLTLAVLLRIATLLKLGREMAYLYFLNPLVIIEISGNLHFEAIVAFFLATALLAIVIEKPYRGALMLVGAALTKLNPLMFLPSFLWSIRSWWRLVWIKLLFLFLFIAAFIPFYNPVFIEHLSNSLDLYFRNFEFNAGLYFFIRNIWTFFLGYNPIAWLGPILSVVGLGSIFIISWSTGKRKISEMPQTWLWVYCIYLFTATTVHPWYLIPLVLLASISGWIFPIIWSALVFLSYSHYGPAQGIYTYLVGAEYILLFSIMLLEWRWKKRERLSDSGAV